jgi:hypothetical protein
MVGTQHHNTNYVSIYVIYWILLIRSKTQTSNQFCSTSVHSFQKCDVIINTLTSNDIPLYCRKNIKTVFWLLFFAFLLSVVISCYSYREALECRQWHHVHPEHHPRHLCLPWTAESRVPCTRCISHSLSEHRTWWAQGRHDLIKNIEYVFTQHVEIYKCNTPQIEQL